MDAPFECEHPLAIGPKGLGIESFDLMEHVTRDIAQLPVWVRQRTKRRPDVSDVLIDDRFFLETERKIETAVPSWITPMS